MFYSEAQHDEYVEIDPDAFIHPYLRITPALLDGGVSLGSSSADERLLLVMHGSSAELLVISTQRILIYKMPETKSLVRRAGGSAVSVATSMAIDAIPIVSDVSTILGGLGAARTIKERFWSKTEVGMPPKKEARNTVWDLDNEQICLMVVCYTDRILLKNGWYWKTTFEMSMERVRKKGANISIGVEGINFKIGGKKAAIGFANSNLNYLEIVQALIVRNRETLETGGWQADIVDGKLVLKK